MRHGVLAIVKHIIIIIIICFLFGHFQLYAILTVCYTGQSLASAC